MSTNRWISRIKEVGFRKWVRGFGLILFVVILGRIDHQAILITLRGVDSKLFVVAVLFLLPLTVIKSIRWGLFFDPVYVISVKERIGITFIGNYFGSMTLGRLGDFVRVMYLKDRGCPLGASLYSIIADKVCDLAATLLMGSLGLGLFVSRMAVGTTAIAGKVSGAVCVVGSGVVKEFWLKKFLLQCIEAFIPSGVRSSAIGEARMFSEQWGRLSLRQVLFATLLTAAFWALIYIRYSLVLISLHASVSFFYTAIMVSVIQLVVQLPVSFMGLGTRDVTLIYMFGVLGMPADLAVSFSLMFLVMSLINAVCGYIVFLRYGRLEYN